MILAVDAVKWPANLWVDKANKGPFVQGQTAVEVAHLEFDVDLKNLMEALNLTPNEAYVIKSHLVQLDQ